MALEQRTRRKKLAAAGAVLVAALAALVFWEPDAAENEPQRPFATGSAAPDDDEPAPTFESTGTDELAPSGADEDGALRSPSGGGELLGIVLAPDGEGLAGVALELVDARSSTRFATTASTDDGSFRFDSTPNTMRLVATRDGCPGAVVEPEPGERVEIVLCSEVLLTGRVLDAEDGLPIVGAEVLLDTDLHTGSPGDASTSEGVSTTDAHGRYRFENTPFGERVLVRAHARGYPPARATPTAKNPGPNELDLTLLRGRTLRGEVVAADGGFPIGDATIDTGLATFPVDANGRFELIAARNDDTVFTIRAPGYADLFAVFLTDELTDELVRFPLLGGSTIAGRVLGPDSAPLSDAYVYCDGKDRDIPAALREGSHLPEYVRWDARGGRATKTDDDGLFLFERLPIGNNTVRSARPGLRSASRVVTIEEPGEHREVELRLATAARITGNVTRNGDPLAGRIKWIGENAVGFAWVNGPYVIEDAEPGEVTLEFTRRGVREPVATRTVRAIGGEEVVVDIELEAPMATIRGRVLDRRGAPVERVLVYASSSARNAARESSHTKTAADGGFELQVVASTEYRITASRDKLTSNAVFAQAGAEDIELVVPDAGVVQLRLVDDATGRPVVSLGRSFDFAVYVAGTQEALDVRTDGSMGTDGTLELVTEAGRVDVVVFSFEGGFLPAIARGVDASTPPGPPYELRLTRGHELAGKLEGPAGPGFPRGYQLFALREEQQGTVRRTGEGERSHWRLNGVSLTLEGDAVERTTLMAQHLPDRGGGKVELDGLPPGDYHFVSVPPGIVFTPASLRVPRDEDVVVTWREAEE